MRGRLQLIFGWLFAITMLGLAGVLLSKLWLRQQQRTAALQGIGKADFVEPTLPPFIVDRTSKVPLASTAAKIAKENNQPSLLMQTALLPTPIDSGVVLEPLDTPVSIESPDAAAQWSVPYIRELDLVLNQNGKEVLIARGRPKTATQSAVTYAYPLMAPNGKLLAFFEWLEPVKVGELITARQSVLKVLDLTTGRIRTTPYRFPQLRHDLDGGLPVRWNARNFLEIEQQSTALYATHILFDPDRNIVLAENNLNKIAKTPWSNQTAAAVIPGFSLSVDGQWRVLTDERQFLINPIGSDKMLPVVLSEITEGHQVRFYGWFYGNAYFEVEKKEYQNCLELALKLPVATDKSSAHSKCYLDTHYLIVVDPVTQQIRQRWYNYQLGVSENLRWIRLTWFLTTATLNHKNEVIFLEPKIPMVFPTSDKLFMSTSPSGLVSVVISNAGVTIWNANGEQHPVTLAAPLTIARLQASSYRFIWTGRDAYLLAYPNDYQRTDEMAIFMIDVTSRTAVQVNNPGRSWPKQ